MDNGTFDFNLFVKESKETLLNPKSYFSTMKISGGITEPLIKAAIYGTVAGIFYALWVILGLKYAGGGMFGGESVIMILIRSIIGAAIGLFIGAVIMLIISSICKGNTDFEANLRVTAALMVAMPISAFFSLFTGINIYLGMIVSLLVSFYSLWLMYNGLVESLRGKSETAKIVCYVFVALIALMLILGLTAKSRFERSLNNYNRDTKELLKDLN
jgi:hypothetical protein